MSYNVISKTEVQKIFDLRIILAPPQLASSPGSN